MVWFVVMELFSTLLEWVSLGRKSESEKTLEILLLRRQLAIVEQTLAKPVRPSRGEKLTLALLATKLKVQTGRTAQELGEIIRIVQPNTVLKWHREAVRRKWTQQQINKGGRPRTAREIKQLVLRLARENDWGRSKANSSSSATRSVTKLSPLFSNDIGFHWLPNDALPSVGIIS
jgi:ClpP class serine protease